MTSHPKNIVFLFDIDNTLLDNDQITHDLRDYLEKNFGPIPRARYFALFEELRHELGYADYLGALQRYRNENLHDTRLLSISSFLIDYPFSDRLYPKALAVIDHCKHFGTCVVLSDGDVVFQPRKAARSGIAEAVDQNVLIYIHKEEMLLDVQEKFPADHYVLVDDKLRILSEIKKAWGNKLTTIFPRQGHYASDPTILRTYPSADITVEKIGDLLTVDILKAIRME